MIENSNHDEMVECHYQGSIVYIPASTFARATFQLQLEGRRFVRYKEGAKIYSMSENKFRELSEAAEAVHHFGKMALIDTEKIDEFLLMC